jgi:hypothetical protein
MMRFVFAAVATMVIGAAVIAQPAQAARCFWNGAVTVCKPAPRPNVVIMEHRAPVRHAPAVVVEHPYR